MLKSIGYTDSDGDGWPNADEFVADTAPGDPTSKPAGSPPSATKKVDAPKEGNPFDMKAALTANHAQHPVLVHFPIALFIISVLFDALGHMKKNTALMTAAGYNLIGGALSGVLAVISGIIAWQWKYQGAPLAGSLRLHLIMGIATTILMLILVSLRAKLSKSPTKAMRMVYLGITFLTLAVISLTGHIGAGDAYLDPGARDCFSPGPQGDRNAGPDQGGRVVVDQSHSGPAGEVLAIGSLDCRPRSSRRDELADPRSSLGSEPGG